MSNSIFDKTVCLTVTFHIAGDTRPGNISMLGGDADKKEMSLSKRIFRSDAYAECWKIASRTRDWLKSRSVPSPLKVGTYLIPEQLVDAVNQRLTEAREEFNTAADAFAAEYPALIEQAKVRLLDQFDERNYLPVEVMRRRFWIERMFLDFTPARPGSIDQQAELTEAVSEIKVALRCGLLELVQRLSGMLGERADGKKKKRLSTKAVAAFTEWMDLLPARLVVDDAELKALADKAKAVMSGKSPADLRDIGAVREQTRKELEAVGCQLQTLVKDMPSRAFGFDE